MIIKVSFLRFFVAGCTITVMDGDKKLQTSDNDVQRNSLDSPPSLNEPSQILTRPLTRAEAQAAPVSDAIPEPVIPALPTPVQPVAAQTHAQAPVSGSVPTPVAAAPADPEVGFYHANDVLEVPEDGSDHSIATHKDTSEPLSWTSSGEALATARIWQAKMAAIAIALGTVIYFITRDWLSAGGVVVAGILFGLLGAVKPQALNYMLDDTGIVIGQKRFLYADFRAFSVAEDTAMPTVELAPFKRFLPVMSLQIDNSLRDQIIDKLARHLPMESHHRDAMDRLINLLGRR